MGIANYDITGNKIIIRLYERPCFTSSDVLKSKLFLDVLKRCLADLTRKNSRLLGIFGPEGVTDQKVETLVHVLKFLTKNAIDYVIPAIPESNVFLVDKHLFHDFCEYLYNYWRSFERFVVLDADVDRSFDKRPYRTFNDMIEPLSHLIRSTYRDIQENLMMHHPSIYRQVIAGAEVGVIANPRRVNLPGGAYEKLQGIPIIRQVLLYPPLILNPPMNKRTGKYERINKNPLECVELNKDEWLCYPAKVGPLLMLVYFHKKFFELGLSLCNLFDIADDKDLERTPDAVYAFGTTGNGLDALSKMPTVFFDDEPNNMLVGAVPGRDEFGYYGYLKKMMLTLHNIKMMKMGRLPFHGAMVRIILKGNKDITVLFIGDTGAGKSETLEAFRTLGEEYIQDIIIVADDMGSLTINDKKEIIGYGTEIGAFLRLDDLQPGYALGQIDRAIIMNANQVNARIILPVTTFNTLIKGHRLDYILYANNYDEIDAAHPIIDQFKDPEEAMKVFREGMVMSKGTTSTSGIVHTYYANVFGPIQYQHLHDPLAEQYFKAFFEAGVFVGQMRTQLGLLGKERTGPEEAAKELLKMIQERR